MDTRLLGYEQAISVIEIASWANKLIGQDVPGEPGYKVVRVIDFQVIGTQSRYDAIVLAEVIEQYHEREIAMKEEDIKIIEQMTSTIEDKT
jgi:hypothetical protein